MTNQLLADAVQLSLLFQLVHFQLNPLVTTDSQPYTFYLVLHLRHQYLKVPGRYIKNYYYNNLKT